MESAGIVERIILFLVSLGILYFSIVFILYAFKAFKSIIYIEKMFEIILKDKGYEPVERQSKK